MAKISAIRWSTSMNMASAKQWIRAAYLAGDIRLGSVGDERVIFVGSVGEPIRHVIRRGQAVFLDSNGIISHSNCSDEDFNAEFDDVTEE